MPTQTLAHMLAARVRTIKNVNVAETKERNVEEIERMVKAFMPSGSGFDSGTKMEINDSKPSRLIFSTSFHHMNDNGMYDGWTEHRVYAISEHDGVDIVVGGRDKRGIKDYIADIFHDALRQRIDSVWDKEEKQFTFINEHGWKA